MNVSGPIIKIIAANVAANALLAGRVYPSVILQDSAYPCAVVNVSNVRPNNTKTQASNLDIVSVQVDIYGVTPTSAGTVADAVRAALDYYSGTVTLNGGGSETIRHIQFEREIQGFSETPELHRIIQQYTYIAA